MAQQIVHFEGIGDVHINKRRGNRNLRISINGTGKVRVSLPYWLPYRAGIEYLKKNRQWVADKLTESQPDILFDGSRIGKSHRVSYRPAASALAVKVAVRNNAILVASALPLNHHRVQAKIRDAGHKALRIEAERLLPMRLRQLADKHGLSYDQLSVKRLSSRWGSCSSKKDITLNYLLMQLPWRLIDYVILHELAHTKYLNHSNDFWRFLESMLPDAQQRRREIKAYRPAILGSKA
jgi:predicted metal-dependent hydrolase